jgi:hypothetical protein
MTTQRQMVEMMAMQERIINALWDGGDGYVADRLGRCMAARLGRRHYDGRPWTCRSAGCLWCGKTLMKRWWAGIQRWITLNGAPVSLAVLPCHHDAGHLRATVARLRRACRDIRDRTARKHMRWQAAAMAGMALGGTALILIRHPGTTRREITSVLCRKWADAIVRDVGSMAPFWRMPVPDAVEIAHARRGVEPLRMVVLPQKIHRQHSRGYQPLPVEPMPIVL